MAQFLDHLHVVFHAFLDALRLDGVAQVVEIVNLLRQVVLNGADGVLGLFFCRDKEIGGVDVIFPKFFQPVEGHAVHFLDAVNLFVPPCDAEDVVGVGHRDVYRVALDAEIAALQVDVVADIQRLHQLA